MQNMLFCWLISSTQACNTSDTPFLLCQAICSHLLALKLCLRALFGNADWDVVTDEVKWIVTEIWFCGLQVTIGSIAAALLGFAGTDTKTSHRGAEHLVEIIAMILLPVAVVMVGYALVVFIWRSKAIAKKQVPVQLSPVVLSLKACAQCHSQFLVLSHRSLFQSPRLIHISCLKWQCIWNTDYRIWILT